MSYGVGDITATAESLSYGSVTLKVASPYRISGILKLTSFFFNLLYMFKDPIDPC